MDSLTVTIIARPPGAAWQLVVIPGLALPAWRRRYAQVRVLAQRPLRSGFLYSWIDAQLPPLDRWPAGVVPVTTARDPATLPPLPPVGPGAANPVEYPVFEPLAAEGMEPSAAPAPSRLLPILALVGTALGLTLASISLFHHRRDIERERSGRRAAELELQRLREERLKERA